MRTILILALAVCSLSAFAQNVFTIEGTFPDMPGTPKKVYLLRDTLSGLAADSAVVSNGRYEFTGHFDQPSPAYLSLSSSVKPHTLFLPGKNIAGTDLFPFFIDKGRISIVTREQLCQSTVTGSPADAQAREANRRMQARIDAARSLAVLYHETDDQLVYNEITDMVIGMERIEKEDYIPYIRRHPDAAIDVWLIDDLLTLRPSAGLIDTLQRLYSSLPEPFRHSAAGKFVQQKIGYEKF